MIDGRSFSNFDRKGPQSTEKDQKPEGSKDQENKKRVGPTTPTWKGRKWGLPVLLLLHTCHPTITPTTSSAGNNRRQHHAEAVEAPQYDEEKSINSATKFVVRVGK